MKCATWTVYSTDKIMKSALGMNKAMKNARGFLENE